MFAGFFQCASRSRYVSQMSILCQSTIILTWLWEFGESVDSIYVTGCRKPSLHSTQPRVIPFSPEQTATPIIFPPAKVLYDEHRMPRNMAENNAESNAEDKEWESELPFSGRARMSRFFAWALTCQALCVTIQACRKFRNRIALLIDRLLEPMLRCPKVSILLPSC
jgi:hypothetical protein